MYFLSRYARYYHEPWERVFQYWDQFTGQQPLTSPLTSASLPPPALVASSKGNFLEGDEDLEAGNPEPLKDLMENSTKRESFFGKKGSVIATEPTSSASFAETGRATEPSTSDFTSYWKR